jgi:BAAT / Acyl-CoA thioester hydrolase C terminal
MRYFLFLVFLNYYPTTFSQSTPRPESSTDFKVGYTNIITIDSGRIYKQNTSIGTKLHFRPIEIDFWYPAIEPITTLPAQYGYFLNLLQQRSNRFQDDTVYNEMTTGLVAYLSSNLNISDTSKLIHLPTVSYANATPFSERSPLIVYLCSYNGMSYENVALFEWLAAHGYLIACITSVGRYPGNMSTRLPDLMEQVADADFAIRYLTAGKQADTTRIGVIGYSWGGLAALILTMNSPNIKCLLSLDGSELHYYGDSKDEDRDFDQIINSSYCQARKLSVPYSYLESGFIRFSNTDLLVDIHRSWIRCNGHYHNNGKLSGNQCSFDESCEKFKIGIRAVE